MQATVLFDSVALCSCLAMLFMLVCSVVILLNRLNQYGLSPREV